MRSNIVLLEPDVYQAKILIDSLRDLGHITIQHYTSLETFMIDLSQSKFPFSAIIINATVLNPEMSFPEFFFTNKSLFYCSKKYPHSLWLQSKAGINSILNYPLEGEKISEKVESL